MRHRVFVACVQYGMCMACEWRVHPRDLIGENVVVVLAAIHRPPLLPPSRVARWLRRPCRRLDRRLVHAEVGCGARPRWGMHRGSSVWLGPRTATRRGRWPPAATRWWRWRATVPSTSVSARLLHRRRTASTRRRRPSSHPRRRRRLTWPAGEKHSPLALNIRAKHAMKRRQRDSAPVLRAGGQFWRRHALRRTLDFVVFPVV